MAKSSMSLTNLVSLSCGTVMPVAFPKASLVVANLKPMGSPRGLLPGCCLLLTLGFCVCFQGPSRAHTQVIQSSDCKPQSTSDTWGNNLSCPSPFCVCWGAWFWLCLRWGEVGLSHTWDRCFSVCDSWNTRQEKTCCTHLWCRPLADPSKFRVFFFKFCHLCPDSKISELSLHWTKMQ